MSVLAILGGLAAPGLTGLWLDAKRTTPVNGFIHSVFLARSTAIQSGRTVTLCRSLGGRRCSHQTQGWQAGWIVFVDSGDDRPPERDPNGARGISCLAGRPDHFESRVVFIQAARSSGRERLDGVLRPVAARRKPAR
jgi:hypothetical protein